MGRSLGITGVIASIDTLSAMAGARGGTWKDCELAARDPDRSIAACSKLLNRPSSRAHAAAFHHRGLAFAAKEKLDQAISDISAGIRLDPQRAHLWRERGQRYAQQAKYQQVIADITQAIPRDPTPRAFRFRNCVGAHQGLGDLPRAIADFDEAIRLDPIARPLRFRARANALRGARRGYGDTRRHIRPCLAGVSPVFPLTFVLPRGAIRARRLRKYHIPLRDAEGLESGKRQARTRVARVAAARV